MAAVMKTADSAKRVSVTLVSGGLLWVLTFIGGLALNVIGFAIGAISLVWLSRRTYLHAQHPSTPSWAPMALATMLLAFAVSPFLPLWGHPGFHSTEAGERVVSWHRHTLFESDHVH